MSQKFVHLHTHTDYSLLDGAVTIDQLIKKTAELQYPAIAITDHGNMFGALELYQKIEKFNHQNSPAVPIKAIIGCEFYVAPQSLHDKKDSNDKKRSAYHLVAIAYNNQGYSNLMKLASLAYTEGFYYRPRIDFKHLAAYNKGLIISSACIAGQIPVNILKGNISEAENLIKKHLDVFGNKRFFLEMQDHSLPAEKTVNKQLLTLSRKYNLKCIATNDIHYLEPDDAYTHEILLCINTKSSMNFEKGRGKGKRFAFDGQGFHYRTREEMAQSFGEIPEVLDNTLLIAEMCNVNLDSSGMHMPKSDIPQEHNEDSYLRELCLKGVKNRYNEFTPDIKKRLAYELRVIRDMKFPGYFLIVSDFIRNAKNKGIYVGPGRGSAAGSLVAYLLDITDLDPLKYDLLFERFLNPERVNMPDIDIDFQDNRREEVIDYVKNKYGADHISQIITYSKLKAKAVIKDVARAFEVDFDEANHLSKLIGNAKNLESAYNENEEFKILIESNDLYKKIYKNAIKLEGITRQTGIHAAGVIISDAPIDVYAPLYYDTEKKITSTQYEGTILEEGCGLIKMDFLGLKTLTVIQETIDLIKNNHNIKININNIPLDDEKTFKLLADGKSLGIFQFESDGMRKYLKDLKPTELNDLIAMNAMYRPGPMKWIPVYIYKKHNQPVKFDNDEDRTNYQHFEKIIAKTESLQKILSPTYTIPIYQEQIMEIGKDFAGFTLGKADILRRAMGKKKIEELQKMKIEFMDGAQANGHLREDADFLFEKIIMPFASYGFNKSHSACYAFIAYQTAYLKSNYSSEFMASLLNSEIENTEKVGQYIFESKQLNIEVLPPNINKSKLFFSIYDSKIIYPLAAIKGVGLNLGNEILSERKKNGEYISFIDFLYRLNNSKVNKLSIENLIKAGCFEFTKYNAEQLLFLYSQVNDLIIKDFELRIGGQVSLFDSGNLSTDSLTELSKNFDTYLHQHNSDIFNDTSQINSQKEQLKEYEFESLGYNFKYNPLDKYSDLILKISNKNFSQKEHWKDSDPIKAAGFIAQFREITTKNDKKMGFLTLENPTGKIDIVLFPKTFEKCSRIENLLKKDNIIIIDGKIQNNSKGISIIADKIELFDESKISISAFSELHIELNEKKISKKIMEDIKENLNLQYGGSCRVMFHILKHNSELKTTIRAGQNIVINPNKQLLNKLTEKEYINKIWLS